MAIDLKGRVVWGTGYTSKGKIYGDADWKEKIKALVADQDHVIVEGRYGNKNLDFHFNIKGFPFSLISRDEFLRKLEKVEVGYTEDVYLYDAFENEEAIWYDEPRDCYPNQGNITDRNRYIFVSHTATECQML